MGAPSLLKNLLVNVALAKTGRVEQTAYHPIAACYLVTYRCELSCVYCLENVRHRCPDGVVRELDTEGVKKTLAGIRACCDTIDLSGGEPALRSDLEEILGTCRELGFAEIMLNSNGLRLLERPAMLRHVHCVMLGVDALTEEAFVRITGGTAEQHRTQKESLETLLRLQPEHGFDLEVCTVLLAGELDEAERVIAWCFEHQVLVSVSPHIDAEFRVDARLRADPRYRSLTERLVESRRKGLPLLGSPGYYEGLRDLPRFECLPMSNLTVSPMGEMFWPCGEIQNRGPSFVEGKPLRAMVDEARARYGPMPRCEGRCHFACRMALPAVVHRPTDLPGEGRHLKRYRVHGR